MKNDDAIRFVKEVAGMSLDWDDDHYEALQLAIDALSIVVDMLTKIPLVKTSTDLVNRADVVKEFIKLFGCIQDVSDIDEWADICQTTVNEIPSTKTSTNAPTDFISKADAIEAIYACHPKGRQNVENPKFHYGNWTHGLYDAVCAVKDCEEVALPSIEYSKQFQAIPYDDLVSRSDAIEAVVCYIWHTPPETRRLFNCENYVRDVVKEAFKTLPSADAVSRELYEKHVQADERIIDSYRQEFAEAASADVVSREEYDKLLDDSISELTKLEKEYDDVIAQLNQKLENSVSCKEYERVLIECKEVKTKLDELQQTVKTVQGEWICKGDYAVCSKCGSSSGTQFDGVERIPRVTAFCPHCGARMKGAKYETD